MVATNLAPTITIKDIRNLFECYGEVQDSISMVDAADGLKIALLKMTLFRCAQTAAASLNGQEYTDEEGKKHTIQVRLQRYKTATMKPLPATPLSVSVADAGGNPTASDPSATGPQKGDEAPPDLEKGDESAEKKS